MVTIIYVVKFHEDPNCCFRRITYEQTDEHIDKQDEFNGHNFINLLWSVSESSM